MRKGSITPNHAPVAARMTFEESYTPAASSVKSTSTGRIERIRYILPGCGARGDPFLIRYRGYMIVPARNPKYMAEHLPQTASGSPKR